MTLWDEEDVLVRVQRSHDKWEMGVKIFVLVLLLILGVYGASR